MAVLKFVSTSLFAYDAVSQVGLNRWRGATDPVELASRSPCLLSAFHIQRVMNAIERAVVAPCRSSLRARRNGASCRRAWRGGINGVRSLASVLCCPPSVTLLKSGHSKLFYQTRSGHRRLKQGRHGGGNILVRGDLEEKSRGGTVFHVLSDLALKRCDISIVP